MNRKLILILTLLVLAAASISLAAAGDDSQDVISSDDSDDIFAEDISADGDKLSDNVAVDAYNEFTIKVVWDDSNDAKSKRPDSIALKVDIKSNPQDITIKSGDNWNTIVKESVYDGDVKIAAPDVSGYTAKVSGNEKGGFTVTLTLDDSNSTSSGDDNNKKSGTSDDKSTDDKAPDKKTSVKKTSVKKTTTTTTTTTKVVKKEPKKTNETNKTKDKNRTGNPVLLGVLALSLAGLAYGLRRRE